MLYGHFLLAFPTMLVQRVEQRRPGAGKFVRLVEVLSPPLEGLLIDHGAAIASYLCAYRTTGRSESRVV